MIPSLAIFIFILSIALPKSVRNATAFAPSATLSKVKPPPVTGTLDIDQPVSVLLKNHAEQISAMKSTTKSVVGQEQFKNLPYNNDVYYLQFCLQSPNDDLHAMNILKTNLSWRTQGKGKSICDAALMAVKQNAAGAWDNGDGPVFAEAPHSATICSFLNPSNILTTTTSNGDLVYCIRAREVKLPALQKAVSTEQLQEFFLYIREVQSLTSIQSSLELDRWVRLITANDLAGASLVGGGPNYFRQTIADYTLVAQSLYPAVTEGPILLLNLPMLLKGIINFITPDSLKANVKFENGLKGVKQLVEVAVSATGPERKAFLQELNRILYTA